MSEKYISGEEHQSRQSQTTAAKPTRSLSISSQTGAYIVVLLVLCGLSFLGGTAYQKAHAKAATVTNGNFGTAAGAGGFGRRAGAIGQVTAVSSTSITIDNQRTGASSTYTIDSSTAISDNGQTVTTSDIQNGATVVISTSGSGSTTATRILVNPSFGGGSAGSSSSSSGSTPVQAQTQ
jgi:hypothetical protein